MVRLVTKTCPKCNEPLHRVYTRIGRFDGKRIQYHQYPIGFVCYHCADKDDDHGKLPSIYHYSPISAALRNNLFEEERLSREREISAGIKEITKEEAAEILARPKAMQAYANRPISQK